MFGGGFSGGSGDFKIAILGRDEGRNYLGHVRCGYCRDESVNDFHIPQIAAASREPLKYLVGSFRSLKVRIAFHSLFYGEASRGRNFPSKSFFTASL
jgi:hypothetical protein